ncbi:MAG: DUF4410 domain-containing protein [Nitrospirae bacterium]|nr:MAG: DUF4410 domain-containing protein [Nitrospirota bacterium]
MKKFLGVITILAVIFAAGAAFSASKAPELEGGGKISVFILVDRGITNNMNDRQERAQNDIGDWMGDDLVKMFNKAGYEATLIEKRNEYTPGPGKYLLKATIVNYDPGSKAARMFVGYGAGAASMDMRYELSGKGESLLNYEDGVGSGRDWRYVARKLNDTAMKRVTEKMNEMHKKGE